MRNLLNMLFVTLLIGSALAQDTLRFCTYNVLNISGSSGSERLPYHATVISGLDPDVLVCQEINNTAGAELFLQEALDPQIWSRSFYVTEGDNDVELYYKTALFRIAAIRTVITDLRNFEIYELASLTDSTRPILYVASSHLKASSGWENEQRRLAEVQSFLSYLDLHPLPGNNLILCGDFNLYTSAEPAYQALLENSRFVDPIDTPGAWNNNSDFAEVHTQSPRTTDLGDGGATGGLDDRFDFILATPEMMDATAWEILSDSYTAYGNDGLHFNLAINNPPNSAVSAEIASALHTASDHLPVYVDLIYITENGIKTKSSRANPTFGMVSLYPNPFNQQLHVNFSLPSAGEVRIQLYNGQGRSLTSWNCGTLAIGDHDLVYEARDLASGLYFLSISLPHQVYTCRKVALVK